MNVKRSILLVLTLALICYSCSNDETNSNVGKLKNITTISKNIPRLTNIFLRLFLAREPTNPDINYNVFTSLNMSKIY